MKSLLFFCSALLVISLTGCITIRNGNKADNPFPAQESFKNKTLAVLPVKSQKSITTDSQAPLKNALNKKIQSVLVLKAGGVKIIGQQTSIDALNDADKLEILDKLFTSYDNTGAYDKKLINSLCSTLKSEYILIPKLKIEQSDLVIAKNFWSSFEMVLLRKNSSEPVWSGSGDFKRSGLYGAGGTETDEAATELVNLAFGQ